MCVCVRLYLNWCCAGMRHSKSVILIPAMVVSLGNGGHSCKRFVSSRVICGPVQEQKAAVQYELCFWHNRRRCAYSS